ncbi:unnamed protein product [Spirodela intermedia]|uniref:Uncharacterized protein n=1 Tax=Spirodela intermedia TaxID=51605 RepID=A0A7I8JBQ3_SPIIN|nr:unnamed protein product [Spirodela intermedia]CAA6666903.1 unnamed protein product [Spirodela intermedia]
MSNIPRSLCDSSLALFSSPSPAPTLGPSPPAPLSNTPSL